MGLANTFYKCSIEVKLQKSTVHPGGPKRRQGRGRKRRRKKEGGGEKEGENGTWLVTKDNKRRLQGASRTQSGVNGPHLVLSQNAEETQIMGHTHTLIHTHFLSISFSLCLPFPAWPDQSRVASSPGPGSPKELSPVVSKRTLQLDQFNVRKREEGEPQCPSVAGSHLVHSLK